MLKFWANNEPLTAEEQRLVDTLYAAHAACVWRGNCSSLALQQAAGGSRSLTQSYIAALASLGEMHGPIEEAYTILAPDSRSVGLEFLATHVGKCPGWGNSFIRGRIDDAFLPVDNCLEANFPRSHARLREITAALHARGKYIFPNPAAYTATTALILGMPRHVAPMLFVLGRTEAWAELFHRVIVMNTKEKAKEAA